jgi:hypothetical protein
MAASTIAHVTRTTLEQANPEMGRPTQHNAWAIDWHRLGRRSLIASAVVLAAAELFLQARGTEYGFDYRGGISHAAGLVLSGQSLYLHSDAAAFLRDANAFITPPLLALIAVPLSPFPFSAAIVAWNLLCTVALVAALRLLGISDWRPQLLAICSFPFVSSLALGQPDGLLALSAAVAWRWRESWPGAVGVATLIAAKLLAWPLLIWLLATRRFRQALIASGSAVGLLLASWACIGFQGLADYPKLLAADAVAFEVRSHSVVTALVRLGVSASVAVPLAIIFAALIGCAVVLSARGSDEGWFTATLVLGLLMSPVMWQHYLVILLIALAISQGTGDLISWLLVAGLWFSPTETPPTTLQALLIPLLASAIAIRTGTLSRGGRLHPTFV